MLVSKVARQTVPALSAARSMASSRPLGKEGLKEAANSVVATKAEQNEALLQRRQRIQERLQRRKQEQEASVNRHMFAQTVDPLTGNVEWMVVGEQTGEPVHTEFAQHSSNQSREPLEATVHGLREDWNDAVVQSSYLDMLNDGARNRAYAEAIEKVVRPGDLVLDIGTGTGLLSMLAVQALKTQTTLLTSSQSSSNPGLNPRSVGQTKSDTISCPQVITCESFPPMARLAETVIQANGMKDDIRVFNKRSDELTEGDEGELPRKADLMVSEILDSELLGEGLLPTLRDAWARLLRPGARTIPRRARVFAQLVECEYLRTCHDLSGRESGLPDGVRIATGSEACLGRGPPAWAVHADAFGVNLKQLSAPFPVFDFDFAAPPPGDRHVALNVTSCADGTAHGLITWWSIDLDDEGLITYTTAPKYALSESDTCRYRGWHHHWRQRAWPFPSGGFRVLAGREVSVEATHDDLGIWYRANPEQVESSVEESGATKEIGDALGSPAVVNVSTKSAVTSATEAAEPVHRNPGLGRPVSLDDGPLDRDKVRTRSGLGESENGGSGAATEASGRTENGHVEASGQPESGHSADVKWSCACGAHVKQSPERIGQLGDSVWREKLSSAVRKAVECGVLEKRAMTSQGRGMTSRDGRSEADGGSDATCQAENESNAEPVQLKHLDVEIDSEAEMSAGAGEGSLTGVSAAQGLETRDAARESSALAPIVLVADDSPLLPLLAAKHLSKLFGQGSSSQEKRKPGHLASENKFSEAFAENALDREASNCRDSTDSESSSTGPLELVTVAGERNADGVAAGLLNGMTGLPGERNGSEAPGVRFLAREGPAVIAGYIETRAEASGIPPAFLPERQAGKEGKLSAEDLGGKKIVALLAEPWYITCESGPPWAHALRFWHQRTVLDAALAPSAPIVPCRAVLRGVAIFAPDLWESRRALPRVEGFDHSAANRLLGACGLSGAKGSDAHESSDASAASDALDVSDALGNPDDLAAGCPVLPFPVWQCGASYQEVSEPFDLLTFDFTEKLTSLEGTAEASVSGLETCHGIALWMEYYSSGDGSPMLSTRWSPGDAPSFHKQGVQLFRLPIQPESAYKACQTEKKSAKLRISAYLDGRAGRVRLVAESQEEVCQSQ